MILLVHLLFGAIIGSLIKNMPLAIILAFLSHYFLDFIPHLDYSVNNLKTKQWRKSGNDILKIITDISLGLVIIYLFSKNQPLIYLPAFVTLIPDSLTLLSCLFPNKILAGHDQIHLKKIHYFKNKKIPNFWRVISQITIVILSILLFKV